MLSSYILNIISSCWCGQKCYLQIVVCGLLNKYFVSQIIRFKIYENVSEQTLVYLILNLSTAYKNFTFYLFIQYQVQYEELFAFTSSLYVPDVICFASVYHTYMNNAYKRFHDSICYFPKTDFFHSSCFIIVIKLCCNFL